MAGVTVTGCGDSESFVFNNPGIHPNPVGPPTPVALLLENQLLEYAVDGNIYRLDFTTFTVARLSPTGQVLWEVGGVGSDGGLFNFPVALATDKTGKIYVADRGNGEIDVLSPDGTFVNSLGDEELSSARDMDLDSERGLIYVADGPRHQVLVFNLEGVLQRTLGQFGTEGPEELNFPSGVAVAANGDVHVVDSGNGHVQVYSTEGRFLRTYGSFGDALGQFVTPRAVAIDTAGYSWVADSVGGYITRFDSAGQPVDRFAPAFPDGTPAQPRYLSVDPSGRLLVTAVRGFVETSGATD